MNNLLKITLVLFLGISVITASAQEDKKEDEKSTEIQVGKLYFAPLPVLAADPAFGFIYGAAASGGIFLGDPSTTNMSSAIATATYSTKNQLMFTLKSNVFTKNNNWYLIGDWRLFFSSQPTYGLGTGPQSEILWTDGEFELGDYKDGITEGEMMDFDLVRFHQTALKQIRPDFYLGIGYHLDVHSNIKDQALDLEADPQVITNHFAYNTLHGFNSEGYTTSGVSINMVYDSRDNVANAYTGRYAFASFRYLPTFLGSSQNASLLSLEYREFINLSKQTPRHILAFWAYGNFNTSGNLPYMSLPALGWDQMGRSGRAYPQGRFRGENIVYAELEYRVPLPIVKKNPDLFGAVAFANATSASSKDLDQSLFKYVKPAAGIGLRVMLQKQSRTNLTLDYGWGANGESAFYLNLTETF